MPTLNRPTMIGALAIFIFGPGPAIAQYPDWEKSGSFYILTTPEGGDLPASASEEAFPLLVRLHRDFFDFGEAGLSGEDVRFATGAGAPLAYQIEEWDAAGGTASIWVRIPTIKGNDRQEIKMYWGKTGAESESDGGRVFAKSNGYVSVLHMDGALRDEIGTITAKDLGTGDAAGIVGKARRFEHGQGIDGGEHVKGYPFSDGAFTSEAWFRAGAAGSTVFYWGRYATRYNGKTGDGNEVSLSIGSPPSLGWASDGPGGAGAEIPPVLGEWTHVAATYDEGTSRIYVNGTLAGTRFHKAAMSVVEDIGVCIGGMRRQDYRFVGEVDEVRVSGVARSADWMRMQYENQKAMQTMVGPLVRPGAEFSVSESKVEIREGEEVTLRAEAGGAQKIYWTIKKGEEEKVVAVDRFALKLSAGRVTGDTAMVVQLKAVFADGVKTREIPVAIAEDIPEPVVALAGPTAWNGRDAIAIVREIRNLAAMESKGAGESETRWAVSGGAVIKESSEGKLTLKRSQYSGPITVSASVGNGGAESTATLEIAVSEPESDVWVEREPGETEQPEDGQFYARDDKNEGTLICKGNLDRAAGEVFLKLYADGKLSKSEVRKPAGDGSYAFAVKLKPGLIRYKVEFGIRSGATEEILRTADDLVCGDAFIIQGQSNAEATGPNNGPAVDPERPFGRWIRSFGNSHSGEVKGGWGHAIRTRIWGKPDYGHCQIGAWGMDLAHGLVEKHGIPICIMNGAVGGTRIDQHLRNEENHGDANTIYGRLLNRIEAARLTHGIRGVLWHQGENNQGSASPSGDYDWKSYQQDFVDLSAAWKEDFPNIRNYYVFQIWPSGCNMGGTPAGDMLLEVQRTLPGLYSRMRVMSTLGVESGSSGRGLCHFDMEGYAQIAELVSPLLEQDYYGLDRSKVLSAPNLRKASYGSAGRDEIVMEFDQPMAWKEEDKAWIELDETAAEVKVGSASGNTITLQLAGPSAAKHLGYVSGKSWDGRQERLLRGTNEIPALAFSMVPIGVAAEAGKGKTEQKKP